MRGWSWTDTIQAQTKLSPEPGYAPGFSFPLAASNARPITASASTKFSANVALNTTKTAVYQDIVTDSSGAQVGTRFVNVSLTNNSRGPL